MQPDERRKCRQGLLYTDDGREGVSEYLCSRHAYHDGWHEDEEEGFRWTTY
jgi:hypothetical protein